MPWAWPTSVPWVGAGAWPRAAMTAGGVSALTVKTAPMVWWCWAVTSYQVCDACGQPMTRDFSRPSVNVRIDNLSAAPMMVILDTCEACYIKLLALLRKTFPLIHDFADRSIPRES